MDTVSLLNLHDRLLYADMTDPLCTGAARAVYSSEHGVIIAFESGTCFIALFDDDKEEVASHIPAYAEAVMIHEKAMETELKKLGFILETPCALYVYDRSEPVPVSHKHEIITLGKQHLDLIVRHYHLFTDIPYFTERLESGVFRGIKVDNEIAGFIARHKEGAMGMLEIFSEYRRQGLAYELEGAYINELRKEGRKAYCNVVNGNISSAALQNRLGLVCCNGISDWYRRQH